MAKQQIRADNGDSVTMLAVGDVPPPVDPIQDIYVAFLADRANIISTRTLLRNAGYKMTMEHGCTETWRKSGKHQLDWTFTYDPTDGRIYRVEVGC